MSKAGVKRAGKGAARVAKKQKVELEPEEPSLSEIEVTEDEVSDESEDELDQASDAEASDAEASDAEASDAEENDAAVDPETAAANAASQAASRKAQKELQNTRKLQRKGGSEIAAIKLLWERLRVRKPTPPKEVRDALCSEMWELASPVISDLVLKHDASRIVQTLVKYSLKEHRDTIVTALKGNYYALATLSYGKYLLVKLLHYGLKELRALILDELHGKLRKLMRHREGAYVVEDLYTLYALQVQKRQMIREFWGSSYALFRNEEDVDLVAMCAAAPEKRTIIARNLHTTIEALVEKGSAGFQILHAVMRDYCQIMEGSEVAEFITLLAEQIAELAHTPEGCEVACTIIAKAGAKDRKTMVRALKPHAAKLVTNEYGNIVFTVLLMCVDDTVLVGRTFSGELAEITGQVVTDKYARRPFLYLLTGAEPRYFNGPARAQLQKYREMLADTSKKPEDQRRAQNLAQFAPGWYEYMAANVGEIVSDNLGAQFVSELCVHEGSEENDDKRRALLEAVAAHFSGDVLEEFHPIHKPFSARLLRTLVQGGVWNNAEKRVDKVAVAGVGEEFAGQLWSVVQGKVADWALCEGSFVVVLLYEDGGETVKKAVKKEVKKDTKKIKSAAKDNKGAKLLLEVVA